MLRKDNKKGNGVAKGIELDNLCSVEEGTLCDFCRQIQEESEISMHEGLNVLGTSCAGVGTFATALGEFVLKTREPLLFCCFAACKVLLVPASTDQGDRVYGFLTRSSQVNPIHLQELSDAVGISLARLSELWEKALPAFGEDFCEDVIRWFEERDSVDLSEQRSDDLQRLGRSYKDMGFDIIAYNELGRIEWDDKKRLLAIGYVSAPRNHPILRVVSRDLGAEGKMHAVPILGFTISPAHAGAEEASVDTLLNDGGKAVSLVCDLIDNVLVSEGFEDDTDVADVKYRSYLPVLEGWDEWSGRMKWAARRWVIAHQADLVSSLPEGVERRIERALNVGGGTPLSHLVLEVEGGCQLSEIEAMIHHMRALEERSCVDEDRGRTIYSCVLEDLEHAVDQYRSAGADNLISVAGVVKDLSFVDQAAPLSKFRGLKVPPGERRKSLMVDLITHGQSYSRIVAKAAISAALDNHEWDPEMVRKFMKAKGGIFMEQTVDVLLDALEAEKIGFPGKTGVWQAAVDVLTEYGEKWGDYEFLHRFERDIFDRTASNVRIAAIRMLSSLPDFIMGRHFEAAELKTYMDSNLHRKTSEVAQ